MAAVMPLMPVILPMVQIPIRKITASSKPCGRSARPTSAITTMPAGSITASTACALNRRARGAMAKTLSIGPADIRLAAKTESAGDRPDRFSTVGSQ